MGSLLASMARVLQLISSRSGSGEVLCPEIEVGAVEVDDMTTVKGDGESELRRELEALREKLRNGWTGEGASRDNYLLKRIECLEEVVIEIGGELNDAKENLVTGWDDGESQMSEMFATSLTDLPAED